MLSNAIKTIQYNLEDMLYYIYSVNCIFRYGVTCIVVYDVTASLNMVYPAYLTKAIYKFYRTEL